MSTYPKTINTTWNLYNYDIWGNKEDGYEVNNTFFIRPVNLTLKVNVYNQNTEREFSAAYPSDYQIKKLFNVGCKITTSGDDATIYVNRDSDGYPIGEMRLDDNRTLSPIYWRYEYRVDLNERGIYVAHVEDESGKIIFRISNEDSENGELWIIEDGFMRHTEDMAGLTEYLIDIKIIPPHSLIVYKG